MSSGPSHPWSGSGVTKNPAAKLHSPAALYRLDHNPHIQDWETLLEEWDVDVVPPYQLAGEGVYSLAPLPREME
jgi:hypothetical protein